MENLKENPLQTFLQAVRNLTRRANQGEFEDDTATVGEDSFSLESLVSCFVQVKDKDNFLTEKPLQNLLGMISGEIAAQEKNPSEMLPEGVLVTAVVTPCDLNGLSFPDKYFHDRQNDQYPYFRLFYSNPADPRGLALGFDNLNPAPYLMLQPPEVRNQCSFVVRYGDYKPAQGEEKLSRAELEMKYLDHQISGIYHRLQSLIKEKL
jgi:hypothetical protein